MPENSQHPDGDPLNRLKIDAGSLAKSAGRFAEEPLSATPDEERAKQFAALRITMAYNILALIRKDLIRLVQEHMRPATERDWSYLEKWCPPIPEELLAEEEFSTQIQEHTQGLVEEICRIEMALPRQEQEYLFREIEVVYALLNAVRRDLFQFVLSLARKHPEDQILTYIKMHSEFTALLASPGKETADE
ncbi:hypothetical protein COU79_03570 [Candidatus Peregrinibacteria bacterium CG10_big_fil_rev_8_21_14_0_10_54_7]|nr:MAG: hypothetical protein COU79_03570 [Candidatus Peregrinibacteria bacterium CG10_big_fil_rev_8_21_14_0_10_54_7]